MKTTVKLNSCSRIVVNPTKTGHVLVEVESAGDPMAVFSLTPDQVGALIFGMEQALPAASRYPAQEMAA